MKKRDVLNSPRLLELKKDRRKVILNKVLLSLLAFFAVFALAAYFSRMEKLLIRGFEVTGNKVVEKELIENTVRKEISGKYLWLFPKSNVFLYPKNEIKDELHNASKRLKDITLSAEDGGILKIAVTERVAAYIWCGDAPPLEAGEVTKCDFLDDTGYLFDEAPYFSGEVYFKFYGPLSESYFLPNDFSKLAAFKRTIEGMGLKPVMLAVEKDGNAKLFLTGKGKSVGPEILFKTDADLGNIAANLETALATEPLLTNFKNKYSSLEYVDLRFGNKVYYRFR